jgi:hypothetical protein
MNREVHVRFCEGLGVKFPRATLPMRVKLNIACHYAHSLNIQDRILLSKFQILIAKALFPVYRFSAKIGISYLVAPMGDRMRNYLGRFVIRCK